MENEIKTIHIDLNVKPSQDLARKVVTSFLDYLLHSRSQIPFHFDLFEKFIATKTEGKAEKDEVTPKKDWKTEKQLKVALETYDSICAVKQV